MSKHVPAHWVGAVVVVAVAGAACHFGDLLSPRPAAVGPDTTATGSDTTTVVVVRSLTLAPADTTLTSQGDSVCLRWTARDAAGDLVPGRTPQFTLVANPSNRLELSPTPGCVRARGVGNQGPGRVRAVLDSASAEALVRASP